jgi:hypothetical protein
MDYTGSTAMEAMNIYPTLFPPLIFPPQRTCPYAIWPFVFPAPTSLRLSPGYWLPYNTLDPGVRALLPGNKDKPLKSGLFVVVEKFPYHCSS